MNDALPVRRVQRVPDLARDWQRFVQRNRPARDAHGEVLAFD